MSNATAAGIFIAVSPVFDCGHGAGLRGYLRRQDREFD